MLLACAPLTSGNWSSRSAGMLSYLRALKDSTRPYVAKSATVMSGPIIQPLLAFFFSRFCAHIMPRVYGVSATHAAGAQRALCRTRLKRAEPGEQRPARELLAQRRFFGRILLLVGRRQQRVQVDEVEQHLLHLCWRVRRAIRRRLCVSRG